MRVQTRPSIEFSPDSRVLGIRLDQLSYVRLLEVGTWKELASLEEGYPLCFSADGSQLATYSDQTKMLMIWDLRRVRRELAAMGLDWESPPLPAEGALVAPALESR